MRTSNPALNKSSFESVRAETGERPMTLQGTVNRTGLLIFLTIIAAGYTWQLFMTGGMEAVGPYFAIGGIGGFVVALVTVFVKKLAPITSVFYAVLEGLFLGGLSAMSETQYPGIVMPAIGLTFGVLLSLLLVYSTGLIAVTQNFRLGVAAATGAVCLFYLAAIVLGFFGIPMPLIYDSGPWGILFSVFVVGLAALNLVLDFDFIEQGVAAGAPKYMEWYAAFGLLVTLVWLYVEILRLLSKLRSR